MHLCHHGDDSSSLDSVGISHQLGSELDFEPAAAFRPKKITGLNKNKKSWLSRFFPVHDIMSGYTTENTSVLLGHRRNPHQSCGVKLMTEH